MNDPRIPAACNFAPAQNPRVLHQKTGAPQHTVQNQKPPMWPRLSETRAFSLPHNAFPLLAFVALLACCTLTTRLSAAEPLHIGLAQVEVTPPVGHRMSGYF